MMALAGIELEMLVFEPDATRPHFCPTFVKKDRQNGEHSIYRTSRAVIGGKTNRSDSKALSSKSENSKNMRNF